MPAKPGRKRELPESIRALGRVFPIETRAMFGGYGIYGEGVFFALHSSEGVLYFRVGDANHSDFEKAGSEPFMPYSRVKSREGMRVVMPYRSVPAHVLEKPATLRRWAEKALAAAVDAKAKKTKKTTPGDRKAAPAQTGVRRTAGPRRATR